MFLVDGTLFAEMDKKTSIYNQRTIDGVEMLLASSPCHLPIDGNKVAIIDINMLPSIVFGTLLSEKFFEIRRQARM